MGAQCSRGVCPVFSRDVFSVSWDVFDVLKGFVALGREMFDATLIAWW